jgi:hypothetical protein
MAGYIGSKSSVKLVDGYTRAEADAAFLSPTGDGSGLTGTGSPSIVDNGNATAMTITSDENIGIGTSSPTVINTGAGIVLDVANTATTGTTADNAEIVLRSTSRFTGLTFKTPNDKASTINFGDTDDSDVGIIQYNHSNNAMSFTANASERIRIDSDGLKFHGDTAAANALNDYEEGTWTPTHTGGSGTGSFSDARYTKIGNTVHVYFTFSFSNGGGSLAVSGFPFNANGNTVGIGREDQTNGYAVYGRINSGDSTVYLYATQASSNASAYQVSNGGIKFAITYETNS